MTTIFRPTIPPIDVQADRGPGTRKRLLDAAAELFATRGYRNVAVRDICDKASANVAAVNYHFGSKDNLHLAAISHARQHAIEHEPMPADPRPEGPLTPAMKLRRHLRGMFGRAFTDGPAGWYLQIVLREMVDPTPALTHALDEHLGPHQRRLEAITAQVLGQDPDSSLVKDTATTILATAIYYQSCRPAVKHLRPGFEFSASTADQLTDVIMGMVLGFAGKS